MTNDSRLQTHASPNSELLLLCDWRFTAHHFVLATSPWRLTISPYVASSVTRGWVCRLQLLLVLASAVTLRSESLGTHDHILLSLIRHSPKLEVQVLVFISPRNRVTQFYPQALGSLFFASYDSQGYGGGIRPRLLTGFLT
jgi:hypothetical protein